jgi:hypothetical protein
MRATHPTRIAGSGPPGIQIENEDKKAPRPKNGAGPGGGLWFHHGVETQREMDKRAELEFATHAKQQPSTEILFADEAIHINRILIIV